MFVSPLSLGPLNGSVLLVLTLAMLAAAFVSLRRIHRGEPAPLFVVATALLLPIVFAAWASSWQHRAATDWAMTHPDLLERQTHLAIVMTRTLATQLYAGLVVACGGLGLLVAALALTVRGERPRWLVGAVATGGSIVLVTVAAVAMPDYPSVVVVLRVGSYAAVVAVSVVALVRAHRRGPGIRLATLTAIVLPVVVAGADMVALAGFAVIRFTQVAVASAGARGSIVHHAALALDHLQQAATLGLGLAAVLALLGPIIAWRRERSHALGTSVALSAVLAVAAVGVFLSTAWLGPLRGE